MVRVLGYRRRRGALNAVWRKCGKPNCACAQPGHRGHGPQYNLTRRIDGKTVNVHLRRGPELDKAEREVAEHQRFAALVEEVTQVSEAICAVRPPASTGPLPAGGKGGLAARLEEVVAAEVGTLAGLAGLAAGTLGSGSALGVLEQAMRAALTSAGARLLQAVLDDGDDGYAGPAVTCPAGHRGVYAGSRPETIRERRIRPLPPREPVPDMLYVQVDGTGVPVRASEPEGRQGKDGEGRAGTREVKLARLFTVSRLDQHGRPVTDLGSSSYAFTFDGKDALAELVKAEYLAPRRRAPPATRRARRRRRLDLDHGRGPLPARHPHRGHLPRPRAPA